LSMSRLGCPVNDPGQDIGEIGERIDVVNLASLDQGRDDSPMLAPPSDPANSAFLAELDATDRSFDGIVVEFDASVIDEARQALPARESVTDGLGKLSLLADESQLGAQSGPAHRPAVGSSVAARGDVARRYGRGFPFRSHRIGDVLQRIARDRRWAGCCEFVEVAPHVHPAEGELDRATFGKLWVGVVAIDLQHALEAGEMAEQPLGLAVGCIDIGDAGRIEAAPGPVVGGVGPELAGLGAPSAGIDTGTVVSSANSLARRQLHHTKGHDPKELQGTRLTPLIATMQLTRKPTVALLRVRSKVDTLTG
jgi:hypothetical protein